MNTKKNKGFTLIEVMTAVAIIGILAVITFVSFNYMKKKSNDSKRKIDIANINLAIQRYITAKGYAPTVGGAKSASDLDNSWTTLQGELGSYIAELPTDPCGDRCHVDGSDKYFNYEYILNDNNYSISAKNLETKDEEFKITSPL